MSTFTSRAAQRAPTTSSRNMTQQGTAAKSSHTNRSWLIPMLLVGLAFLGLFLALVSGAGVWGVLHFAHKQATPATVEMVDNTLPTEAQISVVQGEPAHE